MLLLLAFSGMSQPRPHPSATPLLDKIEESQRRAAQSNSAKAQQAPPREPLNMTTIMRECENGGQFPLRRGACKVAAAHIMKRATERLVKGDRDFWQKNTALALALYMKECVAYGNTHPDGCYEAAVILLADQAVPKDIPTGLAFLDTCCGVKGSGNMECCRIASLVRADPAAFTVADLQPRGFLAAIAERKKQRQERGL